MSKVKEKLREKILKIKGGEFKEWYDSLGEVSKKIYKIQNQAPCLYILVYILVYIYKYTIQVKKKRKNNKKKQKLKGKSQK